MTRPTNSLLQHLLTRSDLARLEIPAATILSWLANAWLEQVGRVPDDEILGDPVFTVLDANLRQELAARLATIGKPTVVLTPLRVRSFLMRAMLGQSRRRGAQDDQGVGPGSTLGPAAQHLEETDLMKVLQEAAADLEDDVEAMLTLAQEEAQLEAVHDPSNAFDSADQSGVEQSAEEGTWFDTDDLVSELDAWEDTAGPGSAVAEVADDTAEHRDEVQGAIEALAEHAVVIGSGQQDPGVVEQGSAEWEAAAPSCAADSDGVAAAEPLAALQDEAGDDSAAHVLPVAEAETLDEALFADLPPTDQAWAPTPEPGADAFQVTDEPTLARAPAYDTVEGASEYPKLRAGDGADQDVVSHAMGRVEMFLTELKSVLVELAHRPTSAPVDIQPLVAAVRSSVQDSAEQTAITHSTLLSLGEKWASAGERIEQRIAQAMPTSLGATAPTAERATTFVEQSPDRAFVIALAVVALALCWSVLFWFKTGSPRMALGTLVGANVLGCVVLAVRGR